MDVVRHGETELSHDEPVDVHDAVHDVAATSALAQERISDLEAQAEAADSVRAEDPAARVEQLETLLGNLQELLIVADSQRRITYVAGNCMGLIGYSTADLQMADDLEVLHLIHREDRALVSEQFTQAWLHPQGSARDVRVTDQAGEARWVECTLVPLYGEAVEGLTGYQVILRDIGDRVRADQMMRSLNQAAAAVQEASLSLDGVLDAATSQLQALGLCSAVGLFTERGDSIQWAKVSADARRMQAFEQMVETFSGISLAQAESWGIFSRSEILIFQFDHTLLTRLGMDPVSVRQIGQLLGPLTAIVVPLRADAHDLGYLIVASTWLSDNHIAGIRAFANQTAIAVHNSQLVGMLADSETQYRAIFESARDGMLIMDAHANVVAASETTCVLFGCTLQEMQGQPADRLFTLSSDELVACCQDGIYCGQGASVPAHALRYDGGTFPVELRGSRLTFGDRVNLMVLITDISERILAQEALVHSERLSALGQMAGGIAHDFNNILVSIMGYAQMAGDDAEDHPERLADDLVQIQMGARDAADAVSRLQALYRDSDDRSDFVPVQLDDILVEALALNRPRWKDIPQLQGITFHVETKLSRPDRVLGNASELRRVLSNLIINAIEAMPNGGLLTFETSQSDDASQVIVRDTGTGMPIEVRQRIFEPFFTTKKSSGLGLTVCANIIRRHEGDVQVESQEGVGTTITVAFPRCWQAAQAAPSLAPVVMRHPAPGPTTPARSLRVLVVDDEPNVRVVLARILERDGHSVHAAESGHDGIAALMHQRYDLLICDLGMPDLPGSAVMRQAHNLAPEMPIVLATGWGETITPDQLQRMSAGALLAKPFGREDVRRAIRTALAAGTVW